MDPPRSRHLAGLAAAAALLSSLAPPAGAIVRRDDRPDSAYRALAARPHPACVIANLANGTLIAPRWVLTAAHVADQASPYAMHVRIGDVTVPYDSVRFHPGAFLDRDSWVDLALLHLARPVEAVTPAPPYPDSDEAGRTVLFLGTGAPGEGRTGPGEQDHRWRGAVNRIIEATPRVVRFRFDAPPEGEELEGISGPGDSGGPALIERDGRLWIAGVSSTNHSPEQQEKCTYGTIETYARVSTQRAWIDSIAAGGTSPGWDWTPPRALAADGWPAHPLVPAVRAWFDARNANDPERLEACFTAHADSAYRARRTPAQRAAAYGELWTTFGRYTPVAWSRRHDGTLGVLVAAEKGGLWLDYRFVPSPGGDGRLTRIESIDLNAPGESFSWPPR